MTEEFFRWVREHAADNPSALRLKYVQRSTAAMDYSAAITQIECRRNFATKFATTLGAFADFYFPSVLAGEQATSDILAAYHASLVEGADSVVDLTAGLGIDAFHIAGVAGEVVAVDIDKERAEALRFNSRGLGIDNICVEECDCRDFVDRCIAEGRRFSAAFIDPARRGADGRRVFALADCEPDVVAMLGKLSRICGRLIVKASPMLDIAHTAEAVGTQLAVAAAVGSPTECKELLLSVEFGSEHAEPLVEAVVFGTAACRVAFRRSEEGAAPMPLCDGPLRPGQYIYEAYPEVMKTGMFKLLAARFRLGIFHPNTRLFWSDTVADGFPGRIYKVEAVMPYASKVIKRFKKEYPQINVATRNFGLSADALRGRLGVADGGTLRLYGYTDASGQRMLAVVSPI